MCRTPSSSRGRSSEHAGGCSTRMALEEYGAEGRGKGSVFHSGKPTFRDSDEVAKLAEVWIGKCARTMREYRRAWPATPLNIWILLFMNGDWRWSHVYAVGALSLPKDMAIL